MILTCLYEQVVYTQVWACMVDCLSCLSISGYVKDLQPVQGVPHFPSSDSYGRLQLTLNMIKWVWKMDEWIWGKTVEQLNSCIKQEGENISLWTAWITGFFLYFLHKGLNDYQIVVLFLWHRVPQFYKIRKGKQKRERNSHILGISYVDKKNVLQLDTECKFRFIIGLSFYILLEVS